MRRSQLPSQTPPKPAVLMDDDDDDAEAQPARAAPAAAAPAGATPSAGQRRTRSEAKTSPAVQRSVDGAAAGHAAGATPVAAELSPPAAVAKPARALKYDPATEAEKLLSLCQKHSFLTAFDKTGQPNPDLFKSFRKDLVHMYTAFAFCNSCAESGRHNHNCWFVRADTLAVHIAHKHREVTSPTVANADVLRGSIRMTLALWAASAGVAEVHVRRFGELLGSRLSTTPLPISQRAIVSYDRLVADAADVSDSCAKRSLREQSFVAVSFDGGRWQHKGQYLLVTVAHSPAGMFVLRPQTSETPYDGKSIAECFTTTLHAVGAPILHAMVDGCTANFAALKGVEILAQELAAVDLDSDEDEAAGEGEADNADPRKNVLEKLAEALHDVNMLDIASRYPKRLLCIAHWLKNRVLDIQKTLKSDAMTAVSLLTKALFSNDGPSVRRGQLRRFIREKRIALTRQSTGALVALADDLTLLLAAMRSEDTEGAVETFATLKTSLLKEIVCVQGGDITATTIQALKFDDVGAIDTLTTIKERLVAAAASTKITPRAVRIATTNQTRWHSSVYASYVFLAEYLHYVKEFFDLPARQTSDSAKKLHELLSVPETFDAILAELGRYTSSLEPMADLLTLISDVSAARPMAHRMHSQFEQMRKKLADQPEGTPGRLLAAELFDAKVIGEEKIAATLETFWYVKLFVPGSLVGRGQAYKTRFNAHKLRASYVRLVFGFTDSEFPECEWELWNEHRENVRDSAYTETPMLYWASDDAKMRFPTLHKAALYVLSLPVAVTSCDSVISVMGAAFSTRQNALSTDKSSALLAFRCNGDTEKKTLDPSAFPRWGDRIATTTTTTTA